MLLAINLGLKYIMIIKLRTHYLQRTGQYEAMKIADREIGCFRLKPVGSMRLQSRNDI